MLRPLLLAAGAAAVGLQAMHTRRHWGATAGEVTAVLPGDEFVPDPAENTTLAVTVAAPPEQVGRGRPMSPRQPCDRST